jgi:thiamine-phosphate pyrophosphorylase
LRDLSECRLYGIVDLGYIAATDAPRVTEQMLNGGVDIIQLRAKQQTIEEITALAAMLHALTAARGTPLIVNDHADVARHVPVEGVHVGKDDDAVARVRKSVGRPILVGKSTHSLEQASAAQQEKPDYIGFGPLFATPTKPDYPPIGLAAIAAAHTRVALPIFCIGGIKLDNLAAVIAAGAKRVVIVSGLLQANDIADYAKEARALLAQSEIENPKS